MLPDDDIFTKYAESARPRMKKDANLTLHMQNLAVLIII